MKSQAKMEPRAGGVYPREGLRQGTHKEGGACAIVHDSLVHVHVMLRGEGGGVVACVA
jgi:hypothetical protein